MNATQNSIKIQTIDVHAKEWFDKVNGNSYFSARATINYGMPDEKTVYLPFQYGYGSHYQDMAMSALIEAGLITDVTKASYGGWSERLWSYCDKRGIILRTSKDENCKQRDVKSYGIE